jgi:hypothetical protein
MKSSDTVLGLVGIGIAILAAVLAAQYGLGKFDKPGPGFLPFLICVILIALNILLILKDQRAKHEVEKLPIGQRPNRRNLVYFLIASFVYTLVWEVGGFLLNTFLLLGFMFRVIGKDSVIKSLGLSLVISLLCYVLFKRFLGVELPGGLLNLGF